VALATLATPAMPLL